VQSILLYVSGSGKPQKTSVFMSSARDVVKL
jgi:hypothetical protein